MSTIIQTPTPNQSDSINFYTKLKFQILSDENPILVSDGKVVIEINPDRFARAGVKLYSENWDSKMEDLSKVAPPVTTENGFLVSDPSGVWVYLLDSKIAPIYEMSQTSSLLGNYAGISLETTNMSGSIAFWSALGFSKSMGSADQGWVAMTNDEGAAVSIMKPFSCPHLFFNPSLTYFNSGKNPEIIEKIRDAQIPITEEISVFNKQDIVDNIIIRDPGGFGFFIFND